jgi:hypothetical protein
LLLRSAGNQLENTAMFNQLLLGMFRNAEIQTPVLDAEMDRRQAEMIDVEEVEEIEAEEVLDVDYDDEPAARRRLRRPLTTLACRQLLPSDYDEPRAHYATHVRFDSEAARRVPLSGDVRLRGLGPPSLLRLAGSHRGTAMPTFKPGDRVMFTRAFLKRIATPPTDPLWFQKGTVIRASTDTAKVQWDHGGVSTSFAVYLKHENAPEAE